jgi:outer membrane lipoprotein-sorting protein
MMKKSLLLTIVFILSIFLDACVPSKPAEEEKIFPSDRLIKKLEGNRRKVKTFRGTGKLDIETENFGANANFEILIKKPDSVKISIYGPFGIDIAYGIITNNDFVFYDVLKNEVHEGNDNREILNRLFKMDITFHDLMDALAGAVNLTDKLRREPDNYRQLDDKYILTYLDDERKLKSTFTISSDNLALLNYRLDNKSGETIFEGEYKDFREFDGVPVPYKNKLVNEKQNQSLTIEYRTIKVNTPIEKMAINLPSDATVIKW